MNLRMVAIALALGLVPSVPAFAEQVPQLSLKARVLIADGAPGVSTSSPNPMVINEGVTSYIFASADLCGVGGAEDRGAVDFYELLALRGHVWKVTRTGVNHANGKLTFDLDWMRYDKGEYSPAASGRQRLTLSEGASFPIDLLRPTGRGRCNVGAVTLEIEAGSIEVPALADTILQYDVWVTHQDGNGKKDTKHVVVTGKQGKDADFDFAPFRFHVPTLAANQYKLDLVTRIMGVIKGRLREDGTVGIDFETRRADRLERPDDPKPQAPSAVGRKRLQVKLGETVEIELPRASGFHAHAASADSRGVSGRLGIEAATGNSVPLPAVALKDGMVVVNFKEFFADNRFSVLVRVRKG